MAAATTIEPTKEVALRALTWPEQARALVIATDADFTLAGEMLRGVKALAGEIDSVFGPLKKKANESHRAICDEEAKAKAPLSEAERIVKRSMAQYHEAQERARRIEQQRLEAEVRRQEEDRRLAEATELEAEGRHEEAEEAISAPATYTAAPVAPPPPKVQGVSFREAWSAEVTDLKALVAAVAEGKAQAGLVMANQQALDQLARALKATMAVPGVKVRVQKVVAAGAGR